MSAGGRGDWRLRLLLIFFWEAILGAVLLCIPSLSTIGLALIGITSLGSLLLFICEVVRVTIEEFGDIE